MAQEFTIKSTNIEDKINQLLPSQGGQGAGIDFSASTMVIPVVDLTETAEGSSLRQDLQTSLSLTSITSHSITNTTTTIINTTGYFLISGTCNMTTNSSAARSGQIKITDGTTTKTIKSFNNLTSYSVSAFTQVPYNFIVLLQAGDSVTMTTNGTEVQFDGITRQLADLSGNLVNP